MICRGTLIAHGLDICLNYIPHISLQFFTIAPIRGNLKQRESMMCTVIFIAHDLDLILTLELIILQYLTIAPIRGNLKPGESMMCRVTFIACGVPSFYDLDLVCEVCKLFRYMV